MPPVTTLIAGEHSCIGHLSQSDTSPGENQAILDKQCMLVYCGKFKSMDGDVEITEAHIDKLMNSHNEKLEKFKKDGRPESEYYSKMPPLQLDHSTSARDTIGRVVGPLSKGTYNNEDGVPVSCLMCSKVLVLGKHNVEHVIDGRWANVSIGADLELGVLSELSITPFPAAPHASLLSRKRLNDMKTYSKGTYKGYPYHVETDDNVYYGYVDSVDYQHVDPKKLVEMIENYVDSKSENEQVSGKSKLSEKEGEKMETKEELKKRHMSEKDQLASSHAEELKTHKLEEVKSKHEEETEKMKARHMAELKKLGVEPGEEDLNPEKKPVEDHPPSHDAERMAAAKPNLIKLAKAIKGGMATSRLAARQQMIVAKIARLRAGAKMTPAEQKKIDVVALSKQSDSEMDSFFQGYEIREDVIDTRFHGTIKALSLGKLEAMTKTTRLALLEAEGRKDMGLPMNEDQRKTLESEHVGPTLPKKADEMLSEQGGWEHMMKHLAGLLGEHESKNAVLEHVKKMMDMKHMGEMPHEQAEGHEKQMSALVKDFNKLQNEFQDLIAMIGDVTGIQKAELE